MVVRWISVSALLEGSLKTILLLLLPTPLLLGLCMELPILFDLNIVALSESNLL